ncbi:nucleotide exchange factor GrpE [bacterium]|nr:nucleotide exchange factor GrpE [bacterium]
MLNSEANLNEEKKEETHQEHSKKKKNIFDSFSKDEKLLKEIEEQKKEIENLNLQVLDLNDKLTRKVAEFDNFRKRREKEFIDLISNANEKLIASLLPVIDDFERTLKASDKTKDFDIFLEGVNLVKNKFTKILENQGLKTLEAVGKPFNTEEHDAMLEMEKEDTPKGIVLEEYEKGYLLNDKLIRHAKVIVSK